MAFFLRGVTLLYEKRFKIQDSPSPLPRGNHEMAVLQFIHSKKKKTTQRVSHTCSGLPHPRACGSGQRPSSPILVAATTLLTLPQPNAALLPSAVNTQTRLFIYVKAEPAAEHGHAVNSHGHLGLSPHAHPSVPAATGSAPPCPLGLGSTLGGDLSHCRAELC